MKAPTNTNATTATIEGTRSFSIKASAKAFRTLIDGIYSNKILAPVRELMTNAYDAHTAAGNLDRAFTVIIPDRNVPEFGVRDYGVGMDHDMVMNSYSTLFESTKDTSNEEVGMLGLGSKSPFAYTSAFTLTCWDGASRRTYSAHLNNDMPQISLMSEVDDDGERGVEVKFLVEMGDVPHFSDAIQRCLLGFDVTPEFVGGTVPQKEVTFEGDNYRLVERNNGFRSNEYLSAINVRMGCVVYPAHASTIALTPLQHVEVPSDVAFIVDVPIGTSDTTTNREQLSDAEGSSLAVASFITDAFDSYKREMTADFNAATNQVERAEAALQVPYAWRRTFDVPRNPFVELQPGLPHEDRMKAIEKGLMGYAINTVSGTRRYEKERSIFRFEYEHRGSHKIIIDDPNEKRRKIRMKQYRQIHQHTYMVTPTEAPIVKRLLIDTCGFAENQFIPLADIHDPGPPERAATGPRAKKSDLVEALETKYWLRRMRGKVTVTNFHNGGIARSHTGYYTGPWAGRVLGLDFEQYGSDAVMESNVVHLTEKQIENLEPDPDRNVGVVLRKAFEREFGEVVLAHANALALMAALRGEYGISRHSTLRALADAEGFNITLPEECANASYIVHGTKRVNEWSVDLVDIDEIRLVAEGIKRKYPALFLMDEDEELKYIGEMS